MKKKELKDLNKRLIEDLNKNEKECVELRDALDAAKHQAQILYSSKEELEDNQLALLKAYKDLKKEFESYQYKSESELKDLKIVHQFNHQFLCTTELIRSEKIKYILLFSLMQRNHLMIEDTEKNDNLDFMLGQLEFLLASL